jgi:hypothetical protein
MTYRTPEALYPENSVPIIQYSYSKHKEEWLNIYGLMFNMQLLGAFENLWKTTINFVMSILQFLRFEQFGSHWTDFFEIWYLSNFQNLSTEFCFH